MKLKQFIFALVAMLLGFSVTASAQQLLVNCDYNSSTEGWGTTKFSNYAGAYAYATANAKTATIVIEKTNTLSGNTFDNNHKNYSRLKVVIKDGATMGNAASKWDMTYPVTVEPGGTLTCARPASASVSNVTATNSTINVENLIVNSEKTINLNEGSSLKADGTITSNGSIKIDGEEATINGGIVSLPVAKIGNTKYATLQAAINAAKDGDVVEIFAGEYSAIDISNKNITIKGAVGADGELLTTIKGGNPAIAAHGFNGTIKDIKIVDAFKVMYAEPAGNVTVDNIYVTGATYGLHLVAYSTGLTWTIQKSYMDLSWANSFGVYGGDAAIIVKGNTFKSTAPYYPDYGALAVNTFLPNVTIEENIFGENTKIYIDKSVTDLSNVNISKNYHADGVDNAFADDTDGVKVDINQYYANVTEDGNLIDPIVRGLDGEGTEASPYLINNVDELVWFRDNVDKQAQDGTTQYAGKYIKLTADIDLAGINWNPIGSMSGDHGSFKGVFDGDNHIISNLNVEQEGNGIGFFARTSGNAVVKNLNFNNVTVKSTNNSNYVGGVVGNAYASTKIENVHVTGNVLVSGRGYIGGIAGHGYVVMDNVSVVANEGGLITSTFWCAGGILGYAGEGSTDIKNAHVEGLTITSAAGGLGAIVGMAEDNNGTQPISGSNLSAKNVEIKTYTGAYGDSYSNYALGYLYGGNPTSKLTGDLSVENVAITTSNGVTPEVNDAVATVDGTVYFDFEKAITNAEGKTVTLLKDVEVAKTFALNSKTFTLDGKGKTIRQAAGCTNTYALLDITGGNVTIKNVTFDGVKGGAVVRTVGTEFAMDNVTAQNCEHTQLQGLFRLVGKNIITNSTFKNNTCTMVMTLNFDGASDTPQLVDNCVFEGNTVNGTAALYYVKGAGFTLTNSEFTGNTVKCNTNGATIYLGFTEDNVVTGNLFKDNKVVDTSASTRVAGAIFFGYEANISGNVFVNNTATNANSDVLGQVCTSTYYGGTIDLGSNYWGGEAPVYGKDYTIQHQTGEGTFALNSYYTTYTTNEQGNVVVADKKEVAYAAQVGKLGYATLAEAVAAVKEGETVTILAGTHSEGAIKLPATLKNVTIKGAEGAILKDMTISAADGNAYSYVGLKFDGITFDNSRLLFTGWRNGDETIENLTVTNCTFKNLSDDTNTAPVHINKDASEAVKNFTFTNNVIDGATGGSKSGVYAQLTGEVVFTGNVINNVSFRPYVIQLTTDDGIADNFTVTGNTFSGSAVGRAQGLGNNATGTDEVVLVVSNNIFKGITGAQQICYWNFNAEKTTADLSGNYYDIDIVANPGKIYYNSAAQNTADLIEKGIFPIYTALNTDGTINMESAYNINGVATKAELENAIANAKDGETIVMIADIDYGTDQLAIAKNITLDLGGKTLTTRNAWGGMSIKGYPTIKNGNIVHASNTAAIKVWNATAFEDLVIDVQGKGDANKTIGGIVLQSGSTTRVGSIKNVTIKGAALTNGIETYNCGDATENVIGAMENVTIDAQGTGMLISAPCGTATNCSIKGGVNGIEIWIKGNYSASLDLMNSKVEGGVYAHDEFNSNPGVVNIGKLSLTADEKTTGASAADVTLTLARAENVAGVVKEVKESAKAKVNDTYYATLDVAIKAAKAGDKVTVFEGTYTMPSMKAGITVVGEGKVLLEGTLSGTLENLTLKNLHIKGGNAQRWAYAKGDLVFENVTFKATSVYALHFDGIAEGTNLTYKGCTIIGWAAMGGSPASCVFDGCTIKGNGTYGVIRTYFDATINNCTFDVANVNTNDVYQDGIHAVEGAKVTVTKCTNVNGAMEDLVNVHGASVVTVDGVAYKNVAKVGDNYYATFADAYTAAQAGETVTMLADLNMSEILVLDKAITLDGNGKTLTSTAGRAINVDCEGNVGIKNLTINASGERAINVIKKPANVTIENVTASAANYTVNLASSAGAAKVAISNSNLTGLNVVNVGAPGSEITINGGTLTCNDQNDAENYAALALNKDAVGAKIAATGVTFDIKGDSKKAKNGAEDGVITIDGKIDEVAVNVAYIDNGGDYYYAYTSIEAAIAKAKEGETITLIRDVTMDYNARDAYATQAQNVVINGNGNTLTLNQKNSDWASFGLANNSKLVLNNMTIEKTGYGDTNGAWNTHAIIFSCPVEMNNVTVNNSVAVQAGATLNNVTINEAGEYYGLWINGNGQTVTLNGGVINATNAGRGIKIADQYIDAPEQVTLNVAGTVFNTAKKAAVLVSSKAGAKITASNVNIENVAADQVNFVWVDEDWAQHFANVQVEGATVRAEGVAAFTAAITANGAVQAYYKTLAEAVNAAEAGAIVELLADVTLAGGYTDAAEGLRIEKEITLNGNGHTIDCGNFQKGIRVYNPSNVSDFNVNFNNVKVVNKVANGRCIDTRSGNINLKVNSSTLVATNGNSQPLTIGGNDPVHRVTLNGTTIDAGTSGYAVISFVSTNVDINGANNSTISGYAAFYLKGDAKTTNLNLGQGVYTGTNNHAVESGLFGTIVLEGDNNVVNLMGTNATVKAVANSTAPQAAFLVRGANNTIKVTKESAKIITEGNAYEAIVDTENAATTKFIDMGVERKLVAEVKGRQFYSFEEAVRFAGNEGTIKVVNDFELAEAWTIPAGKKYTIDLNGKTVTYTSAVAGEDMITNRGNLTITDSSDAKTGKLAYMNTDTTASNVTVSTISTEAGSTLVVDGGTIENKTVKADGSSIYSFAIDILTNGNLGDVNVTINGGTVYSDYMAIRQFNNGTACKNSLTINGGYIYGAKRAVQVHMDNNAAVTAINGGKVEAGAEGYALCNFAQSGNFSVTGGEFIGAVYSARENFISGGTFNNPVEAAYCADGYMPNKNENGTYGVVAVADAYASIDGVTYGSLAAAINAAKAGETITLLQDITEDVIFGKSITIDGASKKYTGNIQVKGGSVVAIIKNVNFVNGSGYAVTTNTINNITIENCTVTGYTYGFLNANKSTATITVKDVTIDGGSYGLNWNYGTTATLEGVVMTNVKYGIHTRNYGAKTFTINNCKIDATTTPIYIDEKGTARQTFAFEGVNNLGKTLAELSLSQYAVIKGANVGTFYGTLQSMVAKAENGQTVKLLSDITMKTSDELASCDGYPSFIHLEGKAVTVDLNGKAITATASAEELAGKMLVGVFSTDKGGELTLADSSAEGTGSVTLQANDAKVYSLLCNYNPGCKITVNGGTYTADKVSDCLIFSGARVDDLVTINGGNFTLVNVGTGENGKPWIFNVLGSGDNHVLVKGGTFNADINRQHWSNEVVVPETHYTVANADGTYTVKEGAVAYVNEGMLTGPYFIRKNIGYETLAEAIAAVDTDETVTMLKDVTLEETLTITADKKNITLDLNGKTVSQTKAQTAGYQMILNDGELTIDDSSEAKTGKISYTDSGNGGEYISDVIYNRATLVINGGTIENLSSATVASNGYPHAVDTYSGIRNTTVTINGGTIYCAQYSAIRMFCVSATYSADLVINGGNVKGAIDMQNGTKVAALGSLSITGGKFETTKNSNNIRFANWNGGATEYGITASITGGDFYGGITTQYVPAVANWNKGIISGGTFANDMTEYCATDFRCVANSDGRYIVERFGFHIVDGELTEFVNDKDVEGATITYERKLWSKTAWNPLYVPFEIPVEMLIDNYHIAYLNDVHSHDHDEDGEIDEYVMEHINVKKGTLRANFPYLIYPKNEDAKSMSIVLDNVTLFKAEETTVKCSSVFTEYAITGTYKELTGENFAGKYALTNKGAWKMADTSNKLDAFRFYMTITDQNGQPVIIDETKQSIRIVVRGEEGTTDIEGVEFNTNGEELIFDLQGRRVLEPKKGGIYIINGKKVYYNK